MKSKMKHLFDSWSALKSTIRKKEVILFLDYDGTLTPIVSHPRLAVLSPKIRSVINKLNKQLPFGVTIVSGRSLSEIKRKVNLKELSYVGNHGYEMQTPYLKYIHPEALKFIASAKKIQNQLKQALKKYKGIFVEDKTMTLSVHYRNVALSEVASLKKAFLKAMQPYIKQRMVRLTHGKKVWEIRPPVSWGKGKSVQWLLTSLGVSDNKNALPIFIGDDKTDEDAFKVLKKKGIGIKICSEKDPSSAARYYLKDTREVLTFLNRLLKSL